ncbi:MAG TPA: hypothetical protein VGF67_17350 [Ktedonobacteraceae bacterium]|jgi:hypothetical protein
MDKILLSRSHRPWALLVHPHDSPLCLRNGPGAGARVWAWPACVLSPADQRRNRAQKWASRRRTPLILPGVAADARLHAGGQVERWPLPRWEASAVRSDATTARSSTDGYGKDLLSARYAQVPQVMGTSTLLSLAAAVPAGALDSERIRQGWTLSGVLDAVDGHRDCSRSSLPAHPTTACLATTIEVLVGHAGNPQRSTPRPIGARLPQTYQEITLLVAPAPCVLRRPRSPFQQRMCRCGLAPVAYRPVSGISHCPQLRHDRCGSARHACATRLDGRICKTWRRVRDTLANHESHTSRQECYWLSVQQTPGEMLTGRVSASDGESQNREGDGSERLPCFPWFRQLERAKRQGKVCQCADETFFTIILTIEGISSIDSAAVGAPFCAYAQEHGKTIYIKMVMPGLLNNVKRHSHAGAASQRKSLVAYAFLWSCILPAPSVRQLAAEFYQAPLPRRLP